MVPRHSYRRDDVAALVDHTLLKPEATGGDVARLARRSRRTRGVRDLRVTVHGRRRERTRAPAAAIAAVVGFPSGKHLSAIKAEEARLRWRRGQPRSTWSSMSAPRCPAISPPFERTSRRSGRPSVMRRPEGDRGVGGAARLGGSRHCVSHAGPPRTPGRTSSRPQPGSILKRWRIGAGGGIDGARPSALVSRSRPAAESARPPTRSLCSTRGDPAGPVRHSVGPRRIGGD